MKSIGIETMAMRMAMGVLFLDSTFGLDDILDFGR